MIDGRDLWFPDYVWTGDVKEVDNTIIKDYAQSVLKEKAMLRALHIDDRPWKVADLNVEECLELKKLTEVITNDIHKICNEVGLMPMHLLNIWINENPPGVENPVHTHLHHADQMGALFSGVYYVECDPELDQGDIVFERKDTSALHIPDFVKSAHTPFNKPEARYVSATSDLYLFSAWIPHRITMNNSTKNRYSISFNYGLVT